MKLRGGIEPKHISLFPSSAHTSVAIHVCLHLPCLPFHISQKLEIQLVVSLLEHISVGHLQTKPNKNFLNLDFQN